MKKQWYDYLWIVSPVYLFLGLFNIMFAWLGLIFFMTPLLISLISGNKMYCNRYCDRGQFLDLLGKRLSRNRDIPKFLRSHWFRYGFLIFFMTMFIQMVFYTYQVFMQSQNLKEVLTLFWTWKLPWSNMVEILSLPAWMSQFGYGFYSMMLTSTLLGIITMILYKPRSWCVYCPMGTMTQMICKIKNRE